MHFLVLYSIWFIVCFCFFFASHQFVLHQEIFCSSFLLHFLKSILADSSTLHVFLLRKFIILDVHMISLAVHCIEICTSYLFFLSFHWSHIPAKIFMLKSIIRPDVCCNIQFLESASALYGLDESAKVKIDSMQAQYYYLNRRDLNYEVV
jgi:hypothetical protein